MHDNLKFETLEEGIAQLKKAVEVRDKMGGAMYYNIMNDDCCEIARTIKNRFGWHKEIGETLGEGTYF